MCKQFFVWLWKATENPLNSCFLFWTAVWTLGVRETFLHRGNYQVVIFALYDKSERLFHWLITAKLLVLAWPISQKLAQPWNSSSSKQFMATPKRNRNSLVSQSPFSQYNRPSTLLAWYHKHTQVLRGGRRFRRVGNRQCLIAFPPRRLPMPSRLKRD